MKHFYTMLSLIVVVGLMAACAQNVPSRPKPQFNWQNETSIPLNVSSVNVIEARSENLRTPYVGHLFPVTVPDAVRIWADERFRAMSPQGNFTITIESVSIKEEQLPLTEGIQGWFTTDQAQRYDGEMIVTLSGVSSDLQQEGTARITVKASRTVSESASIQQRDKAWVKMTEEMLAALDTYTIEALNNKLSFLRDQNVGFAY